MSFSKISLKDFGFRALVAFLMLCPAYYNNRQFHGVDATRLGQEQFFQFGAAALFVLVFIENLWLALFFFWALALNALYGAPSADAQYIWNIFTACILYYAAYHLATRQRAVAIFRAIAALLFLNLALMAMQACGYDPFFHHAIYQKMNVDLVGFMGVKGISGMFNAFCLPMAVYFSPLLALPVLFAIYFSESSCAMAAGIAVVVFLVHRRSKKWALVLLAPLLIAGALYVARDSKAGMMTEKANMWKAALSDAFQRPVVGLGLDSFRNASPMKPFVYFRSTRDNSCFRMYYDSKTGKWAPPPGFDAAPRPDGVPLADPWDNPHNIFVTLFYEFGIVGLVLMALLVRDVFKRFVRRRSDKAVFTIFASFLAYLICSVGQFPFHLARTAHLAVILLAFFYKLTDEEGEGAV